MCVICVMCEWVMGDDGVQGVTKTQMIVKIHLICECCDWIGTGVDYEGVTSTS